mmetsp:Transcript_2617/g.5884  ORF Transcript_2617/g.5884 Transcript_2617/m.5884 type:complete len:146 (-) Transcript_2617:135-572(-)
MSVLSSRSASTGSRRSDRQRHRHAVSLGRTTFEDPFSKNTVSTMQIHMQGSTLADLANGGVSAPRDAGQRTAMLSTGLWRPMPWKHSEPSLIRDRECKRIRNVLANSSLSSSMWRLNDKYAVTSAFRRSPVVYADTFHRNGGVAF